MYDFHSNIINRFSKYFHLHKVFNSLQTDHSLTFQVTFTEKISVDKGDAAGSEVDCTRVT